MYIMSNFKVGQIYAPEFKKLSKKEVLENIDAVAYASEERNYSVQLSEEQIQDREKRYTQNGIEIGEIEAEKKRINDEFNASIKVLKGENEQLGQAVKFKSEQRHGKVFLVDDPERQEMAIFDEEGVCIEVRPMTAGERQRVIKIAN